MPDDDFADVPLDTAVAQALDRLIAGYAAHVVAILSDAELDEPICSIAIEQGQEEELDTIAVVFACRLADRERVLREADAESWMDGWNVHLFRDEEDMVHPTAVLDDDGYVDQVYRELEPTLIADWQTVRDAIEGQVVDAQQWVLARVCQRLNRQPLPVPATADLAVWLYEGHMGEGDLIAQLEFVLRPETLAALRTSGVLGQDSEAGY